MKTETGKADPDHNLIFEDIAAQAIATHIEAALDCNTKIDTAIKGAAHNECAPPIEAMAINLTTTCHISHMKDHPRIEVLQVINPEIAVGHINNCSTDVQGRTHVVQIHTPADHEENHTPRRT